VDRTRVWLAVSPLVAFGVLVAHTLAYRITGTPAGSMHAYLEHAPQILVVLTIASLAFAGLGARLRTPAVWPFPAAALATFVAQEHVERFAHTGQVPWLFDSATLVVGLLLQLPVALLVWALARRLLAALADPVARRRTLPRLSFEIVASPASSVVPGAFVSSARSRAPPLLHAA
jgi:hypothetical protein